MKTKILKNKNVIKIKGSPRAIMKLAKSQDLKNPEEIQEALKSNNTELNISTTTKKII